MLHRIVRHVGCQVVRAAVAGAILATRVDAADPAAPVVELPAVQVVVTTPLPGLGVPLKDVPANVQTFGAREIDRQRLPTLGEFLLNNAGSVTTNAAQGNTFQPDIYFRGFAASPVLGTPQGISVFVDGARVNESFGDVVNWDLIPRAAIARIDLLPGSNPVFGLNTLGGALSIRTKDGRSFPGASVELSGGSFGRGEVDFEVGGAGDRIDGFLTGTYVTDSGWAEHNSSKIKQLFGKVGWREAPTELEASLNFADNTLEGNQTIPLSFLDDFRQAYTFPDRNTNKVAALNLVGRHEFSDRLSLAANAYYRNYRNTNVSSNVNDDFEVEALAGDDDEPQGFNDRSTLKEQAWGVAVQVAMQGDWGGRRNQLVLGASGDFGTDQFTQDSQPAEFTPDRAAIGIGDFVPETAASTRNRYLGLYFADTLELDPDWSLSVSGRYNVAKLTISDNSGESPELNGVNTFRRFNPAVGITYSPSERLTAYAAYNQGTRAPSALELTCADPAAPCKLPNNFLADPPLAQVVSKTVEIGARGRASPAFQWSAALYRTELDNDIQFISSGGGALNAGYFANVGQTRRQGLELGAIASTDWMALAAHYSLIDATYQTSFVEHSPNNSSADTNGDLTVQPGDRIPGIPRQSAKLRVDFRITPQWDLAATVLYNSGVYARGDENNQDVNGKVPGYTVVNLDTRIRVTEALELFARIDNLFDQRYASVGVLGENFFTGPGRTFGPAAGYEPVAEQFRGMGAPRGAWIGLRYTFDVGRPSR